MFTTRGESPFFFAGASGPVTEARPRTLAAPRDPAQGQLRGWDSAGPGPWPPAPGPNPSLTRCVFSVLWETGFGFMTAERQRPRGARGKGKGNEWKLADTLAPSDSQVSKVFLTCGRRAWGPPCWRRGGAWEVTWAEGGDGAGAPCGGEERWEAREVEAPAGGKAGGVLFAPFSSGI